MNTAEMIQEVPLRAQSIPIKSEPLFDVQLLVARRADALARLHPALTPAIDRTVWLRAEMEVFDVI